ncbi:MAG TPA: aminopeptidase P N-terminal domain-containing protein, partial [Blastocatellia bacterium]|nr:aminopeptidase P N-terminal domain-containing protein [Blastocatellia bacterium]
MSIPNAPKTKLRSSAIIGVVLCAISTMVPRIPQANASDTSTPTLANQPLSVYKARRQALLDRIRDGAIVLIGAREEDFGEVGRFRQKNDIMYLTGVETPAAAFMMAPAGLIPGRAAIETVFIPVRNRGREQWTGFQVGPGAEGQAKFGVAEAAPSNELEPRLREMLNAPPFKVEGAAAKAKLYTIVPRGSTAAITREKLFIDFIRNLAPHVQIEDVSATIAGLRKVKSETEIDLLQKAIDITGEGHFEAARSIKPGAFEYQVQGALEYAFTRNGAERAGFPSIVGSGIYSTILHYNESRKKIDAGDVIVVDIGAE